MQRPRRRPVTGRVLLAVAVLCAVAAPGCSLFDGVDLGVAGIDARYVDVPSTIGDDRSVLVVQSDQLAAAKDPSPVPLVVALHGFQSDAEVMAKVTALAAEAGQKNFVAAFGVGLDKSWNADLCCGASAAAGTDDVAYLRTMILTVEEQFPVDRSKVFFLGYSNGGMMAHRLACDASDLFTAITAVAGTDNTRDCHPSRPVSVLHIHARDDERVLFNGGAGQPSKQVTDFTSVADSTSRWVQRNGCQPTPRTVLQAPGARCVEHEGCQGGSRVRLCVTETGGHSWPGGGKVLGTRGSQALSATTEMEHFFFGR